MADDVVIVAGTFTVDPTAGTSSCKAAWSPFGTRGKDRGCLAYAMSADAVDPAVVRLFEMWTSLEDLQAHVQRIQAQPPAQNGVPLLDRDMKIYVHAEEQPFG